MQIIDKIDKLKTWRKLELVCCLIGLSYSYTPKFVEWSSGYTRTQRVVMMFKNFKMLILYLFIPSMPPI